MATHSSILAWRIPRTEEPGGLQSIQSQSWTQLKRLSKHARCKPQGLLSHFSRVQLCVTSQTAAHQAPPSLGFSRHKH